MVLRQEEEEHQRELEDEDEEESSEQPKNSRERRLQRRRENQVADKRTKSQILNRILYILQSPNEILAFVFLDN